MTKRYSVLAVIFAAALAFAAAAPAAPRVQVVPVSQGARLLVAGKLIALFRTPNGKLSPQARAEYAARRLTELVGQGLHAEDIEVRSKGEAWAVYASGGLVMIATPDEAAERMQEPEAVARLWAVNLKEALGEGSAPAKRTTKAAPVAKVREPKLVLSDTSLTVPIGETRRIAVKGSAEGPISVTVDDSCATVDVDTARSEVVVKGIAAGKATVRVRQEGTDASFTVWIKRAAGRVTGTAEAEVTGTTTPAALVRQAAQDHVLDNVEREAGAVARITGPPTGMRALPRGETAQVEFPITISGGEYLPLKTTARVTVRNVDLPTREAKSLLYSNDPESIREFGMLFQGFVDNEGPVRLLFHHQNRTGRTVTFQVHLLNPNPEPVDFQLIQAEAGPTLDTIQVGHRAGQKYLAAATANVGYVARIPAMSVRTIYTTAMPNILTVSGIYSFRITNGGPLVTEVTASASPMTPQIPDDLVTTARSEPHTYPNPTKDEKYAYAVGQKWTFIPLGRKAITGTRANRKLFGNYGVVYNITLDLSNPTDEAKTVKVMMTPEAGWARGVFLFEGQLVEAPQLAPPGEAQLWSVKLAPQEQRTLHIQGIPVGGSAYPVSLVVRS